MKEMKEEYVLHVVRYFGVFSYPPSAEEIRTFLTVGCTEKELLPLLKHMTNGGRLIAQTTDTKRYALPNCAHYYKENALRKAESTRKRELVKDFIVSLKKSYLFKLVAISGSVAMDNAKPGDDIDLFIITERNRMWTARFFANMLAILSGIKRDRGEKHATDKVCLNLFFDASDMEVPHKKWNEYVGHELLQIKPVIDKEHTYASLLHENNWILRLFPNIQLPEKLSRNVIVPALDALLRLPGDSVEFLLGRLQLAFMRRHRTNETISNTQLWFFPNDYEKSLRKKVTLALSSSR